LKALWGDIFWYGINKPNDFLASRLLRITT